MLCYTTTQHRKLFKCSKLNYKRLLILDMLYLLVKLSCSKLLSSRSSKSNIELGIDKRKEFNVVNLRSKGERGGVSEASVWLWLSSLCMYVAVELVKRMLVFEVGGSSSFIEDATLIWFLLSWGLSIVGVVLDDIISRFDHWMIDWRNKVVKGSRLQVDNFYSISSSYVF